MLMCYLGGVSLAIYSIGSLGNSGMRQGLKISPCTGLGSMGHRMGRASRLGR